MRRGIMVCAVLTGWVVKTYGAATAIEAGEALSVGSAIAARNGADLIIEDPSGLLRYIRQPLPWAASRRLFSRRSP